MSKGLRTRKYAPAKKGHRHNIRLVEERRVSYANMQLAQRIVDASGAVDLVDSWRVADGLKTDKGGRPPEVDTRAALTLWTYQAVTQSPQLISHMAKSVAFGLEGKGWDLLGLTPFDWDEADPKAHFDTYMTWYKRIAACLDRVRATIEPFPEVSKKRRYTVEEWVPFIAYYDEKKGKKEVLAKVEERKARGVELVNRLVWASVELMDPETFAKWNGDIAVDGTIIPVSANGNPNKKDMLSGKANMHRLVASTPTLGWHAKEGDHDGENTKKTATHTWGLEATVVAMCGDGFAEPGGAPGLILGVTGGVPAVAPSKRVFESLKNLTDRPELPRRHFIADRLYSPGQNPVKFQMPMRKLGYGFVADMRRDTRGVQTITTSGAPIVDGTAYCPAILNMPRLLDPYTAWEKGQLTDQQFSNLLQARKRLALARYGTKPNKKGDVRLGCPARAEGAEITCPLVPPAEEGKKKAGFQKDELTDFEVPSKASCPKVCQQRTVTLKNTAEDGAKFLQHGPAFMTAEWRKEYGRRNTIESRNAMLKNGSYQGAGDVTTRLMRGWAAQMLCMAMAAVGVNLAMLDAAAWSRPSTSQKPTPPPPRGGRKPDADDIEQWKLGDNAPPKAA